MSAYLMSARTKTPRGDGAEDLLGQDSATFAGHQVKVLVNYGRLEGLKSDPVEGHRDRGIPSRPSSPTFAALAPEPPGPAPPASAAIG